MEINDANLQGLAAHLQQTMHADPQVRLPAEKFLESVERTQNYSVMLLNLISKGDAVDLNVRFAGAIAFKNFVKRNWKIDDDEGHIDDKIHPEDRRIVKQMIVNLMLASPERIQRQLSDAISIIGREDFPRKWPGLLKEMIEKFQSVDFYVINGILHTAHSLFKRYRFEFKSNELWTEIKVVLDEFAGPLTRLFLGLMQLAKENETNREALQVIINSLTIVAKIFYSLSYQDLAEFFEDNMAVWMDNFHALLELNSPLLQTDGNEEVGLLEQLKSQICDNVGLYAQKYDEEFTVHLPKFVTAVWKLLVTTGNQPKYDLLVSNAIEFLALVADRERYKSLFEDPTTMSSICEKVIIPNMEFRQSDEEVFEDNAEEYIRRDIEGSDVDTRRRAACDLVRALSRHFESQMTAIFGQYVQAMLTNYAENPTANWRNKDAAIYLVTSVASKGKTEKHGITQTNQLVNILDFYQGHILPELVGPAVHARHKAQFPRLVEALPVLKADAIKFVMIFRNQLPPQTMKESIGPLVRFLKSSVPVVYTYAAFAIDKVLLLRQADNTALIKSADLQPVGIELLGNLFALFETHDGKENEHIMRAVMRSFSTLQEVIIPMMGQILPKLTQILMTVAKNPSKPQFNHYMFESLSVCIKILCKNNPDYVGQFEEMLFPIITHIMQQDVTEFIPYVFQILSMLLEFRTNGIPEHYMTLFPLLLSPPLWDKPPNIHPLVRLLQVYVRKAPQGVTDKLGGLLGVFQKLIASKANDHEGFNLLQTLTEEISAVDMAQYLKQIFVLLFQRLTSMKTVKYMKSLLVYFGIFIFKYGATYFIQMVDGIQARMFGMVLDKLFIPETQKVTGSREKRILAVGITKLLCEAPAMISGDYATHWPILLQTLIGFFELPEDTRPVVEDHFVEIDESLGYQTTYAELNFAKSPEKDPFNGTIPDVKANLAVSLGKLSTENPGRLHSIISSGIAPEAQNFLSQYLKNYNVQLA